MVVGDLYAVIGCKSTATAAEIKRAYHRQALKVHPDKNGDDPRAKERFQDLNHAYATLGDPSKRGEYDRAMERKATVRNYTSATWNSDIFSGSAARSAASPQQQRKCLRCSFMNAAGAKICARCASRMCNPCPACGKAMDCGYDCAGCGYREPRSMHSATSTGGRAGYFGAASKTSQPTRRPAPRSDSGMRGSVPMPAAAKAASMTRGTAAAGRGVGKRARPSGGSTRCETTARSEKLNGFADQSPRKRRRKPTACSASKHGGIGGVGGRQNVTSSSASAYSANVEEDVIDLSQGPDNDAGPINEEPVDVVDVESGGDEECTSAAKSPAAPATGDSHVDECQRGKARRQQRSKKCQQQKQDSSNADVSRTGAAQDCTADEFAKAWAEAAEEQAEAEAREHPVRSVCPCLSCGKDRFTDAGCAHCGYWPREAKDLQYERATDSPTSGAAWLCPRSLRRRRERERAAARAAGMPASPPPVYEILSDSSDLSDADDIPTRHRRKGSIPGHTASGPEAARTPEAGDSSKSSYDLTGSNSDDGDKSDSDDDPILENDDDDEDCELELI